MSFIPLFINSYDNSFIWELIQKPVIHGISLSGGVSALLVVSYDTLGATSSLSGCWDDRLVLPTHRHFRILS